MVTWYKHDIPAWTDGTEGLDDGPYRVYHVVCQLIYLNEGPIVLNERGIAGRCCQRIDRFRVHLKKLVELGKLSIVDGKLINDRCATELGQIEENRTKAGKGGRAPRRSHSESSPSGIDSSSTGLRQLSEGSTQLNDSSPQGLSSVSDDKPLKYNVVREPLLQPDWSLKTREEKTREEETRVSHPSGAHTDVAVDQDLSDQGFGSSSDRTTSPPLDRLPFSEPEPILPKPESRARGTALVPVAQRSTAAVGHVLGAFEVWWSAYPLKKSKEGARKKHAEVIKAARATEAELLEGALRYAAERVGQEARFTKHPTTWLNNGCWSDEPAQPSQQQQRFTPRSAASEHLFQKIIQTKEFP